MKVIQAMQSGLVKKFVVNGDVVSYFENDKFIDEKKFTKEEMEEFMEWAWHIDDEGGGEVVLD